MERRTIAAGAAALVTGTAAVLVAAPAMADGPERETSGRVAGSWFEMSAEKERGFELDADLDNVPRGSTWRLVVKHDGERIATRTADTVRDDGRWEADFRDVHAPDSAGADTFTLTITRTDGPGKVTRTLAFAR